MRKIILFILLVSVPVFCQPENVALQCIDTSNLAGPVLNILTLRIEEYWHTGQYNKIFPLFFLITRLDPGDDEAWATGGWFLMNGMAPLKLGKERERLKEKGVSFLKEGLGHVSDSYRLYWELAWVYYQRGELETSLGYLDDSVKYEHPSYVENTRAHVLAKLGRTNDALVQWKEIRRKYPEMRLVAERFILELEKEKNDSEKNN